MGEGFSEEENGMTERLQAWCNGYDVVAAHSSQEAESVLVEQQKFDPDEVEGDGWEVFPDDKEIADDDGGHFKIGDVLNESTEPRHLFSMDVA